VQAAPTKTNNTEVVSPTNSQDDLTPPMGGSSIESEGDKLNQSADGFINNNNTQVISTGSQDNLTPLMGNSSTETHHGDQLYLSGKTSTQKRMTQELISFSSMGMGNGQNQGNASPSGIFACSNTGKGKYAQNAATHGKKRQVRTLCHCAVWMIYLLC
jgi:hypothetical protein